MDQEVCFGQVDGMADIDSAEEEEEDGEPAQVGEIAEAPEDLEGEVEIPGGVEEDRLDDAAQTEEGQVQPDAEGHHQEDEEIGAGVEDEEPMEQNHQPDGLAELVSNLGVDVDGIDVNEEGLDLEGEEEQDFEYVNNQNQGEDDLVGEEYLDQDYMEGDRVGEVFEGEDGDGYYDEEQDEDDETYNDEEDGDFYQAFAQPQVKKPKVQEQEEEVILESSDEESSAPPAPKAQPVQQWPHQRLQQQQAQFGLQQPLHQQQQARAPIQAQYGLQQLQQQAMYAELLHGRGGQQQFHHQFAPLQRKRRRRTPTALCIKDGRVFLRPFTDLPPHISAKSLPPPPEPSPYQPPSMAMPSTISGHHLGSAMGLGNPMALGHLGHPTQPSMGQQLGQQLQAAAYPNLLPQFHHQYPQHQMASGQLAVQPGAPLGPQQHSLLQRAAIAARVGGSPTSLGSDSDDRSDSEIEEAEEEELGAMFPQRNKLPLMNLAKQVRIASFHLTSSFHHCQQQQQSKELSLGEDDIETLENEGVDDEAGDNDEVLSDQSNDIEPVAVNAESAREEVMTFEESSKDVQEAEEEIPEVATEAEEMIEPEEEEKDNKEEKLEEEEEEGGEDGAEELQ